jgi:hypothetical protein
MDEHELRRMVEAAMFNEEEVRLLPETFAKVHQYTEDGMTLSEAIVKAVHDAA